MIVVDYLGLIKKPKAERNDLAIAHISRNLKTMAMRLHTPTFALSQLSRAVDSRPAGQRRPVMSDLRDSGSIEQDADSIMFCTAMRFTTLKARRLASPKLSWEKPLQCRRRRYLSGV
jgi:replicative DNA helicase